MNRTNQDILKDKLETSGDVRTIFQFKSPKKIVFYLKGVSKIKSTENTIYHCTINIKVKKVFALMRKET